MRMRSRGQHRFLRNHDVMSDVDVVLVVEPYALANPRAVTDVQLPGKRHPGTGSEDHALADISSERAKDPHTDSAGDLPGVGHKQPFNDRPQVNVPSGTI